MQVSGAICAEVHLLACSLAVGLGLMAVYDGLRIFRILIPHGVFWTGMEDLFYWIGSGISTFLLLFYQNDGILRWYAIGGVLFGMVIYNRTVSRILLKVLKKAEKCLTIKRQRRKQRAAEKREKRQRRAKERHERAEQKREEKYCRKNGESLNGRSTEDAGKRAGQKKEKRKSE